MTVVLVGTNAGTERVLLLVPPICVGGELRFTGRCTAGMRKGEAMRVTFVHDGLEMTGMCRLLFCGRPGVGTFVAGVVAWAADAGTGWRH